ncbi:MAG: radical SAM family heme chaperone HemW [Candidatus Hydrogenedentes bacterium]|nr:radical SAM family heme chaperone HemW [Candidatus Hydrogenedentota bacterium]
MFGVYVHVPYCRTRCPYCDFVSEAVSGAPPDAYTAALCREIAAFAGPDTAGSVFFGGGTPSLLPLSALERVLDALSRRFTLSPKAEITVEANPDDITPGLAAGWKTLGVNRISLGVQSLDDRALRWLGRRHDAAAARGAVEAVAAVFDNWNMDLIFGAKPADAWPETLAETVRMRPPHVAAYGLTYEEGTPFALRRGEAVEEDQSLDMYRAAEEALSGYDHYEISNFALPGRESRHNLVYWHNGEYTGFGTGAYSFVDRVRARNHPDTAAYLRAPGEKSEALALSEHEIRVETLIQHMRLRGGISGAHYAERFGGSLREHFGPALDALEKRGLVEWSGECLRPTRLGFHLNNEIGLALVGDD